MYQALSHEQRGALKQGDTIYIEHMGRFIPIVFLGWWNAGAYTKCLVRFGGRQVYVNEVLYGNSDAKPVSDKARIMRFIRALEFKTVANGCEPGEEKVAREKIKELRAKL